MSKYLLQKFQTNKWIPAAFNSEEDHMGLLLRQGRGLYVTQPKTISQQLLAAVVKLNVEIAFTMVSDITSSIIEGLYAGQEDLYLPQDHSQYQIVESLDAIASAPTGRIRKFQYVCIVRREKLVLLWHDSVEAMVTHVQDVEAKLLALVCVLKLCCPLQKYPALCQHTSATLPPPCICLHLAADYLDLGQLDPRPVDTRQQKRTRVFGVFFSQRFHHKTSQITTARPPSATD